MARFLLVIMLTGFTTFGLLSYNEYIKLVDTLTSPMVIQDMKDQMK